MEKENILKDKLTKTLVRILTQAELIAKDLGNNKVNNLHVVLSMLSERTHIFTAILLRLNIDLEATYAEIVAILSMGSNNIGKVSTPKISDELKDTIVDSLKISKSNNDAYVGVEHLVLVVLANRKIDFINELYQLGFNYEETKSKLLTSNKSIEDFVGDELDFDDSPAMGRDMLKEEEDGLYMNLHGREREISRMIHILSRKTKNNVMILGESGVGKTALVQGLASKINSGDVPRSFMGTRLISLDVASLMSGARVRGDLEDRITTVVEDAIDHGNTVIFIDEVHLIVGAGSQGRDSMDIANLLKPYLTDNRLRVIGATTYSEYSRSIFEDPALSRRFQTVEISEVDADTTRLILNKLVPTLEEFHKVKISEDVVDSTMMLAQKYIKDRYFPDKAIDIIDEAASAKKIGMSIRYLSDLMELDKKVIALETEFSDHIEKGEFAKAKKVQQKLNDYKKKIDDVQNLKGKRKPKVESKDIQDVIISWTKVPIVSDKIDFSLLDSLSSNLKKEVVGQDQVLEPMVNSIKKSFIGLKDDSRPLSSFMFLGPTGVGKTQLAKLLATNLFGKEEMLIQLNMSEYMESHSVSKLIGSPPGYIGYQEGGQLTEQIRKNPFSVVLFDEIEKAHPDVLNILLQILDEGNLQDGKGNKVYFSNSIVILTSNIGAENIARHKKLGFNVDSSIEGYEFEEMKDGILSSLKNTIRPEIINRLDEVFVFRGLNKSDTLEITSNLLGLTLNLFHKKGLNITFDKNVAKYINDIGYSTEYGARNIRRTISKNVEDKLADFIVNNRIVFSKKNPVSMSLSLNNDTLEFNLTK